MSDTATVASAQSRFPEGRSRFRRWVVRRARQLAIAVLIVSGILMAGACGVMLRRATCLVGLPDVGDPFDVAAIREVRNPDDQDAFALFRQALDKLRPMPGLSVAARQAGPTVAWAQADPSLHEWLDVNRDALGLFRQAALVADGIAPTLGDPLRASVTDLYLGPFVWLAFLDSARLEQQGDMKGAWEGYRAILFMKAHVMRRGTVHDRYFGHHVSRGLEPRIAAWASNAKTDVRLIRDALNEVRTLEPKPEWDAYSLKLEYLQMMTMLERPRDWLAQGADEPIVIGGQLLPPDLAASVNAARRFLENEPERCRRVLRLAFANWLPHVQDEDPSRRKPAIQVRFSLQKQTTHLSFYTPGPGAPDSARALAPRNVASWLFTTRHAKVLLAQWPWPAVRISEQREYRNLVVLLAEELYHRERGSLPPSEAALVGPYLDHLPGDGSSEIDDGTAATIDGASPSGPAQPETLKSGPS